MQKLEVFTQKKVGHLIMGFKCVMTIFLINVSVEYRLLTSFLE